MRDYGITCYPATYLIDHDGNIIGKDMRVKNLLEKVRAKMNSYAVK